jgi:hypothetical protein
MNQDAILSEAFFEACRKEKPLTFALNGSSMVPVLRPKDVLIVQPIRPATAAIGYILAFRNKTSQRIVVHRLIRKTSSQDGKLLYTAADAGVSLSYDAPIFESDSAVARVIGIVRGNRKIDLTTGRAVLGGRIRAFLLVHCRLVVRSHARIAKEFEKLLSGRARTEV